MRHLVKGRKLGMKPAHRKATLQALSVALIREHRIITTLSKAKELQRTVEPIITRGKEDTSHNRRRAFAKLQDKHAVTELFTEIGPKVNGRPGGYTRILKTGARAGDSTEMAVIELVDYNDVKPEERSSGRKRTRRGRSGKGESDSPSPKAADTSKKSADTTTAEEPVEENKADENIQAEAVQEPAGNQEPAGAREQPEQEVKAESADDAEANADEKTESATEEGDVSTDFTVAEVKEKLEEMSADDAKEFVGEDERVTVQRALDKKLDAADEESGESESGKKE